MTVVEETASDTAPSSRRRPTTWLLTAGLVLALLVLTPVAAGVGAYPVPVGDVLGSVLHRVGLGGAGLDRVAESVLWNVRFPRIVLALLIGASLGCAGALMQGVFGNPLAEPGVIGVSSGAAVGAVGAIALGVDFLGTWTVSVFAFGSGLVTVLVVYVMARSGGRTEVVTLILTGIAANAFGRAVIGLFLFFADAAAIQQITFWQLGSLSQATWPKVVAVLPCAALGLAVAPLYARRLDLLALGERPARHLGVEVERLRIVLVLVIALLTAAAVSVSGIISFVGLVVPHLLRMAAGPGHPVLVPASAAARGVGLGGVCRLRVRGGWSRSSPRPWTGCSWRQSCCWRSCGQSCRWGGTRPKESGTPPTRASAPTRPQPQRRATTSADHASPCRNRPLQGTRP